jgi:hypothetical protein
MLRLAVAVCSTFAAFAIFPRWAEATSISFSGSELVGAMGVSFPSTAPTISGSSIVFGPSSTSFGKLVAIVLSALGLGSLSAIPAEVTVLLNLTRLSCTGDCATHIVDWDPAFMLSDGSNMIGVQINDPAPGSSVFAEEHQDKGVSGQRLVHNAIQNLDTYPDVGQSVDVRLHFSLTADASNVAIDVLGKSAAYQAVHVLQRPGLLEMVLMRDNDGGEQYQLNSLSISMPALVPEPSAIALLILGLTGIALRRNRGVL